MDAAALAGGRAAEKTNARETCLSSAASSGMPAMNPPTEGMLFDSELILMSTVPRNPKWLSMPRPSSPSTPSEWDSSIISQAP